MKNNNSLDRDSNSNNNNSSQSHNFNQQNSHHDRRKQQQQQQQPYHQQHPRQQQHQQQQQQLQPQQRFQGQRDRSGQRNQGGQHPDSSMGSRDNLNNNNLNQQSNLGSVRFNPGYPTRELPPIETKADPNKKFTGRCRLFVGNLAHNTTEDRLRSLFETYGEVGEVFLGPKSAFAFIKMDTRQNAEAARDALDCSTYDNRTLRVRLAAHAAAIRIKHLSPQVTNELLAYAFRYFGEIERAVVVVDDKGKSVGEGVVEYAKKQSALYAIKRCQQDCFMLTASPKPVLVEPFDQQDEDEGLPEKSINKNSNEYKEQRDVGPRFAEQGTFEHTFALRWKELYDVEKQKRDRLEQEIQEARNSLQDQIEYSRLEHDTMQLRNKLQQLEDDRLKLQQMKEQTFNTAQQRGEQRRQQDMLIQQRQEEILRRQQLGDPNCLNQQESALRMQASALQDILSGQERPNGGEDADSSQSQQKSQQGPQTVSDSDTNLPFTQLSYQPKTFADVAMMGVNHQSNLIPVQQQMSMPPPPQNNQMNAPNMFQAFIPQQMQMPMDGTSSHNFVPSQGGGYGMMPQQQPQQQQQQPSAGPGRQHKFNRQHQGAGNNISLVNTGRPRKRGRY